MKNKQKIISVILCTYNRQILLHKALKSLIEQTTDKKKFEIIVVDNNSTDGTRGLIKKFQKKYGYPKIIYVYEKRQGLAAARNTGIKYACGKYISFLDDDAQAEKNWMKNALNYFMNIKPKPVAVGGRIIPVYKNKKPGWFKDKYEEDNKGDKDRYLSRGESFSGSNMFIEKSFVQNYGGFNEAVGMSGNIISIGEETDLFEKVWKNNLNKKIFFYSPSLKVYHLIFPFKLSLLYKLKRSFAGGQSLYLRKVNLPTSEKLFMLVKYLFIILLSPFILLRSVLITSNMKAAIFEGFSPFFYATGFTLAFFGLILPFDQKVD